MNFYNNWVLPYGDSIGYWSRINELLFWEPGLSDVSIGNLDYSRWFRNAGQVLMRDTWNFPAATLLEFKSTSFSIDNHHHLDQNAFTVFYRAPLLVDSGYYDSYGTPHWYNYFTRSIAHTTITIWDPSESFYHYGNGNTYSNDGGQRYMQKTYPTLTEIQEGGPNHLDCITAYEYSSNYTYTVGNASKAYQSKKLDHDAGFVRSLLYLRAPSFWNKPVTVVFDKVTASAAGAGLTKRFLLHTVNEPVPPGGSAVGPGVHKLPGSTIEVRSGEGLLFSQTLLPEKAVITKIGGKDATNDFRFLVPSRTTTDFQVGFVNYPPRPDPGASLTDTLVAPDMGAWRIEVSAPGATRREYYLHVLSVADDGAVAGPPEAQNLSSDSAAVVLLARSQLVAFNKSDQVDAPLNRNMPVISVSMIVAGLQPNATYAGTIRGNGPFVVNFLPDPNGQLVASAQGVIAVAATSLERVGADNNSP